MTRDLSEIHHFVSDLFAEPKSKQEWGQYRLSDEQVASFRRCGYLAGIRIIDDRQANAIASEVNAIMSSSASGKNLFHEYYSNESSDQSNVLFHALGGWRVTPGLHDLLWNPAFLVPAFQLLGAPVRFWHDQLFCKPARHGGVVAWHQDYSYWTRTQPMAHLTCWIGLDESTVENGCLHYVPGSHRWPLLPITGLAGDMEEMLSVLDAEQKDQFRPVAVPLKKVRRRSIIP